MLTELYDIIVARKAAMPEGSYTTELLLAGEDRILRKIGEEAVEVLLATKSEGDQRLIEESADLYYHLLVLLASRDIPLQAVVDELAKRHER